MSMCRASEMRSPSSPQQAGQGLVERTVPPGARATVRAADVGCPMDEVVRAAPDDRLVDLLPRLNAAGDARALVLEDDRIVGLVTSTDVARAVEQAGLRPGLATVNSRG